MSPGSQINNTTTEPLCTEREEWEQYRTARDRLRCELRIKFAAKLCE